MGAVNLDFYSNVRDLDHPTIGAYELAIPVTLQSPVVSIEYSPGGVILSWEPVTGASHYMIYFADSPDGPWDVYLPVNLTVTTWGDIDSSAQKRFYRVTASN
jgi:hypothetical protein